MHEGHAWNALMHKGHAWNALMHEGHAWNMGSSSDNFAESALYTFPWLGGIELWPPGLHCVEGLTTDSRL